MSSVARFTLEFYEDAHSDQPVLRWLREELTPTQRRTIGVALREILGVEGISVCRGAFGKQLGEGLFEFRLRHDAGEILRSLGKPARDEPQRERILLRVFCHAHGDRIILLPAAMTKARTRASAASSERSRRRAVGWSTSESEL